MTATMPPSASLGSRGRAVWRSSRLMYMLLVGAVVALLLLLLWRAGVFMGLRLSLNDIYYAPAPVSDTVVIIAADDRSLRRYGRTPADWPRDVYAELAGVLTQTDARVLALDLLLSESEDDDLIVAEAFRQLRQNDARTRIVLADAGVNVLAATDGTKALPFALNLGITPTLLPAIDYRGYTNAIPDVDSVIRRYPSLIQVEGENRYSFGIAAYLAYLRIPASASSQLVKFDGNELQVTPERRLPVDQWGLWQPYYFAPPMQPGRPTFTVVSLVDVIDGLVDEDIFEDKIVLVGLMNTTGALDQYLVPSSINGSLMAGVEIQANVIENLLRPQAQFIRPLHDGVQGALIALLALAASLLYALPRWYFKLAIGLVLVVGWLIITSAVFTTTFVMIALLDTLLALTIPVIASIGIDITLETLQRKQTEFLLSSLNRIAEQRLQLDQAAEYILEDVGKIAPGSTGTLYIADTTGGEHWMRFRAGEKRVTGPAASPDSSTYHHHLMMAFPLLWQGRQQGILMLKTAHGTQLDGSAGVLLQELVEKVAPHIDNMLLYDEVERQKTLLNSVFAESPAGIAILDGKGRIVQCNQDLARLLEMNLGEMRGKSLPELISLKSNKVDLEERLENGIGAKTLFNLDDIKLGAHSVRLIVAPLKTYNLWTVVISDVTPLVELSNLKTRMLRIASHDLKNPLARIKGFVDLIFLMTTTLSEQDRKYLQFISDAGDEMVRIIDDILNLERMRSGKLMLSNINFSQMVREVCERNQPDLLQKNQTMEVIIPDLTITVQADAAQLSQAVNNFVGNAIKYTPNDGKIVVRLKSDGQTVRFEVEDTGYGIPAKAQPKIFSEFYRAKAEGTLHIPGTGLGLSLVKAVIESHNGAVGFTSIEGQGSTFYFTLPEK